MNTIQLYANALLTWLQMNVPFIGDHVVASAASGMRVLLALAIVGLCVAIRGNINHYVIASVEEREHLSDGNPAFQRNQLWIAAAFVFSVGAALMTTANIPSFFGKVTVALGIQIVAMIVLRILFREAHHEMMHKNMWQGNRLGIMTLFVGLMTAFEIAR